MLLKMQQDLAKVDPASVLSQRGDFNKWVAGLNDFSTQAVKAKSATQQWTDQLIKQEIHIGQAIKSRQMFNSVLKEQYQLQRMTAVQWTQNASGTISADIIVPKGVNENIDRLTSSTKENIKALAQAKRGTQEYNDALDVMKMRIGMGNQVLGSAAENMIKWGKNTQWAGRQLTVGFAVPFAAFAALAGSQYDKINAQMTRIMKVYDFTTTGAMQQAEAQKLQNDSMNMGAQVAQKYGKALEQTLSVEADLAATGLQGKDLIASTAEVQRAATLGEMDYQSTIKATIAMQSIYGDSWKRTGGIAKNTADTFNYMNSIENATNLSMQDFVAAIPRAAGPLHQLGGNIQDLGVLLTAMKSAGVDAAIGANALKSSLGSLINPSSKALKLIDDLTKGTVNLPAMVEKNGGNYMKTMEEFSAGLDKAFSGLTDQEKNLDIQRVVEALFGKQQYARIGGIIQQLAHLHDATTQVGRAFQVSEAGVTSWANVAQGEMNQVRKSISGQFHIAVESIKVQLAQAGKPFLELATYILKAGTWILSVFNKLPKVVKEGLMGVGIAMAVAGPLIMFTGLLGNLAGQGLRVFHNLLKIGDGFKAMNAEERAAQMLAEQHSYVWSNQAKSAQALAGTIAQLTGKFEMLAQAQMAAHMGDGFMGFGTLPPVRDENRIGVIGPSAPNLVRAPSGGWMRPNGQFASKAEIAAQEAMLANEARVSQEMADEAALTSKETVATERSWGKIAGHVANLGLGVSLMGQMAAGSNQLVSRISEVVFMASLVGPTLLKGIKVSAIKTAFQELMLAFSIGRGAGGGILGGFKTMLPLLGEIGLSALRVFGPIGILASGLFVLAKIHSALAEAKKRQDEIANSAKNWGDILGFIYQEQGKVIDKQGNAKDTIDQQAGAFAKANKAVADQLQTLGKLEDKQQAINAAVQQGVQARLHGANSTQAQQVVGIALRVAGFKTDQINDIMKQQVNTINWDDINSVITLRMLQIMNDLPTTLKNKQDQSKWESLWRDTLGGKGLNAASKEAAKNAGKDFWNAWNQASDGQTKLGLFRDFESNMKSQTDQLFNNMSKGLGPQFRKLGIQSAFQLKQAMHDSSNISPHDFAVKYGANADAIETLVGKMSTKDVQNVKHFAEAEQLVTRAIAAQNGVTGDAAKHLHTIGGLITILDMPTRSLAEATDAYNKVIKDSKTHYDQLNDAQKLQILNLYRHSAGLSDATSLQQGFGNAVADTTQKVKDQADALGQAEIKAADYNKVTQNAMQGAQQAMVSQADTIWSQWSQAQVDAIKTSTKDLDAADKAAQKRIGAQIKASDSAYNKRIKQIQDQLKAEKHADEQRQKMFDAEMTRLQRLADMANNNIDFNSALNTGNLDEAARIRNTMQATQDTNALNDANASAGDASKARQDRLQAEIDSLKNQKQAHHDALQKQLDAEKAANDKKRQLREQDTQNFKNSLQQQLALKKANLDLQIKSITATLPDSKKAWDAQVKQIEAAYQGAGVNLQSYGDSWGKYIGNALTSNVQAAANSFQNDIDWQNAANKVGDEFAKGAFGITLNEWIKWITTGKAPKDLGKAPAAATPSGGGGGGHMTYLARHGGGPIGGASQYPQYQNLAGRDPKSALWNDEVLMRAQVGEYVVNKKAHAALGTEFLDMLNNGGGFIGRHAGGPVGTAGFGYTALVAMLKGVLEGTMMGASAQAMGVKVKNPFQPDSLGSIGSIASGPVNVAKGGKAYGGVDLSDQQLRNAAAIIGVGEGMHASRRDIVVALMTAMQESDLINVPYGDRDSLGLFQQRPSQGWGTPKQIMNPQYSAMKFFQGLLGIKDRNTMALTQEAQAVQRSAYPDAYAKWAGMATAVVNASLPQLLVGGKIKYDNTIANLHRNETVLTAPLSAALERGIDNLDRGGTNKYNVTIDLRGATVRDELDIEGAVEKAIDKIESKKGRTRRINN